MTNKRIVCVSWDEALSKSREALLRTLGVEVVSAVHEKEARLACVIPCDLLVLGHSVPKKNKQELIRQFRRYSQSPVLSLLLPGHCKLPEATFGIETQPQEVLRMAREILGGKDAAAVKPCTEDQA